MVGATSGAARRVVEPSVDLRRAVAVLAGHRPSLRSCSTNSSPVPTRHHSLTRALSTAFEATSASRPRSPSSTSTTERRGRTRARPSRAYEAEGPAGSSAPPRPCAGPARTGTPDRPRPASIRSRRPRPPPPSPGARFPADPRMAPGARRSTARPDTPRPASRRPRAASPRSTAAPHPRRESRSRARGRRTRWTRTARPCRRAGARGRRPRRFALPSRPPRAPVLVHELAHERLGVRPANDLHPVRLVAKRLQDQHVLDPLDPAALLDRGVPRGDDALDVRAPAAVEPFCRCFAVFGDEGAGDGADDLRVRRHVVFP